MPSLGAKRDNTKHDNKISIQVLLQACDMELTAAVALATMILYISIVT